MNTLISSFTNVITSRYMPVGLIAGAVLGLSLAGATSQPQSVNLNSTPNSAETAQSDTTSDATPSEPPATTTDDPAPSDTAPVTSPNSTSPSIPTNSQTASQPAQTSATPQTVSTPSPTLADVSQSSEQQGNQQVFTCHYTMSDGTSYDKLAGSASPNDVAKYHLVFNCPAS